MRKKRIILSVVAGLCVIAIGLVLFTYYQFTHNFHIDITPDETSTMLTALKGAMGEAIFAGKQQLSTASQSTVGSTSPGLIEAYKKDPQKFKHYAEMLDTAITAKKIGNVLVQQSNAYLPRTSDLLVIEDELKLDAWGKPFCLIRVHEKVAILSGGPSRLACDALPLTNEQIAKSDRRLYAGPSDVVMVTVAKATLDR